MRHISRTAELWLSGFFSIMMFGLPAACLAMYVSAKKECKAVVGRTLFSIAVTPFLTGITELMEFTFMFLSPILYVFHALLTGVSVIGAYVLDVHHGFGFSAGAIDYGLATNPLILLAMILFVGASYLFIFYFLIVKLDLKTPSREDEDEEGTENADSGNKTVDVRVYNMIEELGGTANIVPVDYCTTRPRTTVKDSVLTEA
ncbi:PTS transporter subunit EIIC [Planococcus sp. ISL-110]|uniref:PTS transporter subunit EIIC n=1 Tax=Planococcus sp. ISL-110 TaxID=2819167 RepID=UPI001BEAC967|nr:PTS transporter subunit EIIC [Planococcus sp. ISL-110]MBT2569787.1 PTS transporter subunit EIIC [Planococcus sp. ISL-110]